MFQAGVYASHRFGGAFLSGALAYSWYDMTTDRTLTVSGTDVLRAKFNANNVGGRIEAGYRFSTPTTAGTPYAAVQVQRFGTPAYSETAVSGSSQFALAYDSKSTTVTRTEVGYWDEKTFAFSGGTVAFRSRVAWANDMGNKRSAAATFQTLPGASFTVYGANPPTNLALLTAGAEMRLRNNVSLGAKFDMEYASRSQTYSGSATLRYAW